MTVADLIQHLQTFPPSAPVAVDHDYFYNFAKIGTVEWDELILGYRENVILHLSELPVDPDHFR